MSTVTQIGTLHGKPLIQSQTIDMDSQEFQDMVDSILKETNTDGIRYVADSIGWTATSELVGDGVGRSIQTMPANEWFFRDDGFNGNDKGQYMNIGDKVCVTNVGTVTDLKINEKIPVKLEITFNDLTRGAGSTGSDSSASSGAGFIDRYQIAVSLVNANTGEVIPNDELIMAMKISDIDAFQRVKVEQNGVFAYIVSPDTKMSVFDDGLRSTSSDAFIADTTQLSANSYVVLKRGNNTTTDIMYTDNKRNHLQLVLGVFGNTGFELNVNKTGTIVIDKSGATSGKTMLNSKYSLAGNVFKYVVKIFYQSWYQKTF